MPTLLDSEHFSFLSLLFHFSDPFFSSPSSRLSTVPHFSFFHSHGSFVILPVCVVRVLSVDSSPLPSFFSATFTAFYSFLEPFTPFTPFHGALFFFLVGRLTVDNFSETVIDIASGTAQGELASLVSARDCKTRVSSRLLRDRRHVEFLRDLLALSRIRKISRIRQSNRSNPRCSVDIPEINRSV